MEDKDKKEPTVEPTKEPTAEPTPEAEAEGEGEPAAVSLTEESVRKICEEVIGAFLDRFSVEAENKKEEEPKKKEEESFDY